MMRDRWAYATLFFLAASIGAVFAFLADFQDLFGLSNWQLGVVGSVGFVAALVTQLGVSPLVDRGLVLPLAAVSVVVGAVGIAGFALADDFVELTVSRGLVGVGLGVFSLTARKAILGVDIAGGGKKVGALLSTGVGGFIIGPGLGALLGKISYGAPFWFLGAAILITGIPSVRWISSAPLAVTEVHHGDLGRLLSSPRVQAALLAQMVVFTFIGVFDVIMDRHLTDLGASSDAIALALIIIGAPMLVLPSVAGGLAERLGSVRVLLPGVLLIIPIMALYGFAGGVGAVILVGIFHGSGESFATVSAQVMMLEETGTERAAIGNAAMEAVGLGMATVSALLAPIVYGLFGPVAVFSGTAAVTSVFALGIAHRLTAVRRSDQRAAVVLTEA